MCILYWGLGYEAFKACIIAHAHAKKALPDLQWEHSVDALHAKLLDLRGTGPQLVVLAPPAAGELKNALPVAPLLSGIPTIVISPSNDSETVKLAHRFRPRFVSYGIAMLADAAAVAVNIIQRGNGKHEKSDG